LIFSRFLDESTICVPLSSIEERKLAVDAENVVVVALVVRRFPMNPVVTPRLVVVALLKNDAIAKRLVEVLFVEEALVVKKLVEELLVMNPLVAKRLVLVELVVTDDVPKIFCAYKLRNLKVLDPRDPPRSDPGVMLPAT